MGGVASLVIKGKAEEGIFGNLGKIFHFIAIMKSFIHDDDHST